MMNIKSPLSSINLKYKSSWLAGTLSFLLICLVMAPVGTYVRDKDTWELNDNNYIKNFWGKTSLVNLDNLKTRKITVETFDTLTSKSSKKYYRISVSKSESVLNGEVINLLNDRGETLVSFDGKKFKKQEKTNPEFNFARDHLIPPNIKALRHNTDSIVNYKKELKTSEVSETKALNYNDPLREIEFYSVMPEDFSEGRTEEELLAELLRVTFNANQYIEDLNLILVPVGVKVYRGSSRFTQSIAARDPYGMLSAGVEEKNSMGSNNEDLLVILSRTFFGNASGLAYMMTSCTNPLYSVLFASGGYQNSSYELSLGATLAHETGHFLGMSHDDNLYEHGFSLMSSRQNVMPFGFSQNSVSEQISYSGQGLDGSSCFSLEEQRADTDGDGVSDIKESIEGSDPLDKGSFRRVNQGKVFSTWNTFNNQGVISEIGNRGDSFNEPISFILNDQDGEILENVNIPISQESEFDAIISAFPKIKKDSYGIVEINTNKEIYGRTSAYSFNNNFENFRYVNQQKFFKGVKSKSIFLPYNSVVPGTMPSGSKVFNWLSLLNTGENSETFRVRTFSTKGILQNERIVEVPAKGRRDIVAVTNQTIEGVGVNQIEILRPKLNSSFNAFLTRYYLDNTGSVVSSAQIDGVEPSGVKKYFVHDASSRIRSFGLIPFDGYIEVVNSLLTSNSIIVRAELESGQVIMNKSMSLEPHAQTHIQLPSFSQSYILSIESQRPEALSITGLKYTNEFGLMSVETLSFMEELKVERHGSLNTFLNTSNSLILTNSGKIKGDLNCKLLSQEGVINKSLLLTSNAFEIHSLEQIFPEFNRNSYATISCNLKDLNGNLIPSSLRIDRFVERRLLVEQELQ